MVKFYWAIVVASTLTIIAVVAFSKNKPENAALKSKSVERLVKADIKKDQLQATVVR